MATKPLLELSPSVTNIMNLSEINTVSDLLTQNQVEELSTVDKIKALLCQEGNIFDNMPVIIFCVENLIRVHKETAAKAIAEGDAQQAAAFVYDEAVLKQIRLLCEVVDMDINVNDDED